MCTTARVMCKAMSSISAGKCPAHDNSALAQASFKALTTYERPCPRCLLSQTAPLQSSKALTTYGRSCVRKPPFCNKPYCAHGVHDCVADCVHTCARNRLVRFPEAIPWICHPLAHALLVPLLCRSFVNPAVPVLSLPFLCKRYVLENGHHGHLAWPNQPAAASPRMHQVNMLENGHHQH